MGPIVTSTQSLNQEVSIKNPDNPIQDPIENLDEEEFFPAVNADGTPKIPIVSHRSD